MNYALSSTAYARSAAKLQACMRAPMLFIRMQKRNEAHCKTQHANTVLYMQGRQCIEADTLRLSLLCVDCGKIIQSESASSAEILL